MTDLVELYPSGPVVSPAQRAVVRASAEQHVAAAADMQRLQNSIGVIEGVAADRFFDPQLSPIMYARKRSVLHRLATDHGVVHIDYRPTGARTMYDPHDPVMQATRFVHFVSKPGAVFVLRDPEASFSNVWSQAWPERACNVRISADCLGVHGFTVHLTVNAGQYLLVWESCGPCIAHLREIAEGGAILAEADAHAAAESAAAEQAAKWRAIRADQEGTNQ